MNGSRAGNRTGTALVLVGGAGGWWRRSSSRERLDELPSHIRHMDLSLWPPCAKLRRGRGVEVGRRVARQNRCNRQVVGDRIAAEATTLRKVVQVVAPGFRASAHSGDADEAHLFRRDGHPPAPICGPDVQRDVEVVVERDDQRHADSAAGGVAPDGVRGRLGWRRRRCAFPGHCSRLALVRGRRCPTRRWPWSWRCRA